jgi:hypothetical protein
MRRGKRRRRGRGKEEEEVEGYLKGVLEVRGQTSAVGAFSVKSEKSGIFVSHVEGASLLQGSGDDLLEHGVSRSVR